MSSRRITFSELSQILSDLGFHSLAVKDPYVGFRHDPSGTSIVLPAYRDSLPVAAHHIAQVRVTLDANGLMDGAEFDRLVNGTPAPHSASS
jgi:hypothetical protein